MEINSDRAISLRSIWILIGIETLGFWGPKFSSFGVFAWICQTTNYINAFVMLVLATWGGTWVGEMGFLFSVIGVFITAEFLIVSRIEDVQRVQEL
ncbi:MAG: hypothetical protein HQM08_15105 [Candidatus Riflebacteria bacterium]|nr:hypothetical protein [Candidatus Riflebacteria bacterium]